MNDELVLIFQPADMEEYTGARAPEDLVAHINAQFPDQLQGQFRTFPYASIEYASIEKSVILPETEWKHAGLIYTHGEDDNPLSRADAGVVFDSLQRVVMDVGGSANALRRRGRVQIDRPSDSDYVRVLQLGLNNHYEDVGAQAPEEVRRFFLNLDDAVLNRVILPYLNGQGYRVEHRTVE